ncbi:SagB/ThcOx family dehydrogenase [Desulfoplanes formicivorans]|uniref:Nitroreductase n=1 Tax=Desulfoplanes formicivorans TaxID=1592317 RepID=A0A194AJL4_9BACT|nr:SagB/ThcOx family dehydrogenase [Desulfoplanes formicivorans]GAU09430.1 nitroreductase [Desulfoplanes formicivorans]
MKVSRRKVLGMLATGAVAGVMGSHHVLAADKDPGALPEPAPGAAGSLVRALKLRQSTRSFSPEPIPRQLLSDLLWAAFGINRPASGKRTAPSAFNSQEIDLYVIMQDGVFVYEPQAHRLNLVTSADVRELAGRQGYVRKAPVNIMYVADYARMKRISPEQKPVLTAANAGCISQNVYLFCALNALGTVVRDGIDRDALARAMSLGKDQHIVLGQSVGYRKS